jgi:hypothetical protein
MKESLSARGRQTVLPTSELGNNGRPTADATYFRIVCRGHGARS